MKIFMSATSGNLRFCQTYACDVINLGLRLLQVFYFRWRVFYGHDHQGEDQSYQDTADHNGRDLIEYGQAAPLLGIPGRQGHHQIVAHVENGVIIPNPMLSKNGWRPLPIRSC